MARGIVALVFRCEIVDGRPSTTAEAREFAWLGPDQLAERMSSAYSVRLVDAVKGDGIPIVRAHDGTIVVG